MRYVIVALSLALAACGAPPTPAPAMDAGTPDVQPDTSPDAEHLPDHCGDVVMGEHEAINKVLDLDRRRASPNECHLIRNCEDDMRLVHWCATECPETNDCRPGGSWDHVEYRGEWAVAFVCDLGRRCPAN